jgi:hypothetical protein
MILMYEAETGRKMGRHTDGVRHEGAKGESCIGLTYNKPNLNLELLDFLLFYYSFLHISQ